MKKKTLLFLAVAVLTVAGIVTTTTTIKAVEPHPCPNGCVSGPDGCYCNYYYPYYAEAGWQ